MFVYQVVLVISESPTIQTIVKKSMFDFGTTEILLTTCSAIAANVTYVTYTACVST